MKACFAEVLARESACLAEITEPAMLAGWRRRIVKELLTSQSPYVLALRLSGDLSDRADFLDQWRDLITETVNRLLPSKMTEVDRCPSAKTGPGDVDAHKTAISILAAIHGGSTLSQIAQDPRPLNAALDLALAPLWQLETTVSKGPGTDRPG